MPPPTAPISPLRPAAAAERASTIDSRDYVAKMVGTCHIGVGVKGWANIHQKLCLCQRQLVSRARKRIMKAMAMSSHAYCLQRSSARDTAACDSWPLPRGPQPGFTMWSTDSERRSPCPPCSSRMYWLHPVCPSLLRCNGAHTCRRHAVRSQPRHLAPGFWPPCALRAVIGVSAAAPQAIRKIGIITRRGCGVVEREEGLAARTDHASSRAELQGSQILYGGRDLPLPHQKRSCVDPVGSRP